MKTEARNFLNKNGWPNPYGNYENELLDILVEFAKGQIKEGELRLKLYEDIFEGIYATAFQEHIQGTVRLNEVKKAVNYAYKRLKDGQ